MNKYVFIGAMVLSIFWTSCRDSCPESCPDGRIRVGDKCECPPGHVDYKGICMQKQPGLFWLDSTSCDCFQGNLYFTYNLQDLEDEGRKDSEGSYDVSMWIQYENGASSVPMKFIPQSDSVYIFPMTALSWSERFSCEYSSYATGKFSDGRTKLNLNVFFYEGGVASGNYDNPIDSCTLYLNSRF